MSEVHHGWLFPQKPYRKIRLKQGFKAFVLNAPENYFRLLGPLPKNVIFFTQLKSSLDFIYYFSDSRQKYLKDITRLKKVLAPRGMIWVSWQNFLLECKVT